MRNAFITVSLFLIAAVSLHAAEKKIFIIDSYDESYEWSSKLVNAAKSVAEGKATLKTAYMDSKRNHSEEDKKKAALAIKKQIDAWSPDVIIAADDNASKYVIVPYYKNTSVPVVFCGINWDAIEYGFPCPNVTGMLEVSLVDQCVAGLARFTKGRRIGHIGADNETARKEGKYIAKTLGMEIKEAYPATFAEFKKQFTEMQKKVDILLIHNFAGMDDFKHEEARRFMLENTVIPTGGMLEFMAPYVLMTYARSPEEHGAWAASAALEIIEGKSIEDIKVVKNKNSKVIINLDIAEKNGYVFQMDLLKVASVMKAGKELKTSLSESEK